MLSELTQARGTAAKFRASEKKVKQLNMELRASRLTSVKLGKANFAHQQLVKTLEDLVGKQEKELVFEKKQNSALRTGSIY